MDTMAILHKDFNIDIHAKNFVNYLEVIIRPNGKIEYAVPSHQIKLEKIAIEKYGKEEFIRMLKLPESFSCDFMQWLCEITCCISIWNDFSVKPKNITKEQIKSLELLKNTSYKKIPLKLYRGN